MNSYDLGQIGFLKYIKPLFPLKQEVLLFFSKKKKKDTISIRSHSVMTNPAARYINVLGYINNFPITCVNVYGPNMDDPGFFRRQFGLIPETSTTNIIIA